MTPHRSDGGHVSSVQDQVESRLRDAWSHFAVYGDLTVIAPYGDGHINETYAVVVNQGGTPVRYILQRINADVFRDIPALMTNIERVTTEQRRVLATERDASRRALTLVATSEDRPYLQTDDGSWWRAYLFVENATAHKTAKTTEEGFQIARAFGAFQTQLSRLSGTPLNETIPDFHNTPKRFDRLVAAIDVDAHNRAKDVAPTIDYILDKSDACSVLENARTTGVLPVRPTHNDTKANNVLIDNETGTTACVIDLDTLMPGLSAFDFGDLVRTVASPSAEDERDLSKVAFRITMFEALVDGFLKGATDTLSTAEKRYLFDGGRVITLETGIRFLTDYLEGDPYFRTIRPGHNIDRCRTQFRLVQEMDRCEDEARRILEVK